MTVRVPFSVGRQQQADLADQRADRQELIKCPPQQREVRSVEEHTKHKVHDEIRTQKFPLSLPGTYPHSSPAQTSTTGDRPSPAMRHNKRAEGRVVLDCLRNQSEGTCIVGRLSTLVKKTKDQGNPPRHQKVPRSPERRQRAPPPQPTAPPRPACLVKLHCFSPPHDDELLPNPSPILLKSLPTQDFCVSLEVSLRQRSHCCRGRCR